jgi:hypothetical protein
VKNLIRRDAQLTGPSDRRGVLPGGEAAFQSQPGDRGLEWKTVDTRMNVGFQLDRQWHWLRGEMEHTKRPALLALCRILGERRVPYAIIGGVALQVHQREPRTTLDIDVAVTDRQAIPRQDLSAAGFAYHDSFERPENWRSADGTPVQFNDDPALAPAVSRADEHLLEGVTLRVIQVTDLLHEKLRAGRDPARRRSKRLQDLADAQALLEGRPDLQHELSREEQALLDTLPK